MKSQKYPWSCGAAAVRNVFRSFKINVSEAQIRSIANTSCSDGTNEEGIMRALREWGLRAVQHRFDSKVEAWDWLHETLVEGKQVILAVENWEHWVVALGSAGQLGVVIFDSSNFKKNKYENGTHIWNKKQLFHKWWNDRKSIDDETESRIYAISVSR